MKNTTSPKPNRPSSKPNMDNILEPTKQKAITVASQITHAALAKGSFLASDGVIVPSSVGTKPKIAIVVASGKSNIQPFHIRAARYIWAGTRNKNTKFQNLFLVSQLVCVVAAWLIGACVLVLSPLVKSCIKPISNYWFKTYSFIVSKSNHVLKQIIVSFLSFCLCLQVNGAIATPVNQWSREDIKRIIAKAEIEHKIPKGLLGAIAKVESSNKAYAINVGGMPIYSPSLNDAISTAKKYIELGKSNIDLGVMQLNYRWHGNKFTSIKEMLAPEKNITYAARLLCSLYKKHGNWHKAVRHYHSAKLEHSRKYSRKVAMVWLWG